MEQITVKQAYFYTVSFILLMMMLYSLNGLVWQVIGIVAPPPLILGQWDYEDAKGQLLWENTGNGEHNSGTTRGPSFRKGAEGEKKPTIPDLFLVSGGCKKYDFFGSVFPRVLVPLESSS